jgi:predicted permease
MEALRDQRGLPVLEDLVRDVRYGMRTLRRSPVFTVVAVLTLTLGIGANAAIFQLLEAIRFRTLPVKNPEQLVVLALADMTRWEGRRTTGYPALTNALWEEFRDRQRVFAAVLAWSNAGFRLDQDGTPRYVRGLFVSGDFFNVLGVEPVLGRVFAAADDRPGCGLPGAVVSHGFWQRQFGGDPTVIGRTIPVEGRPLEVIGVTPPSFFGVEVGRSYDVAVPICAEEVLGSEKGWLRDGTIWWLTVMGRVPPDQTLAQVNAQLDAASPGLFRSTLPDNYSSEDAAGYLSLKLTAESASGGISALRTRFTDPLLMLAGVAGLVLLIVCTNVASLVLSRASTRQREFAVRQSLGASRRRLVQQVMVENVMLAIAGAALGLTLAGTLSRLLVELLGPEVSVPVRIDVRLISIVTITVILTSLTFGLVPAWRASRPGALHAIKNASVRGASASAEGFGFRKALVVSQVAISLVLLFGALLFVGTLRNLLAVDSGFQSDGIAIARIDFSRASVSMSNRGVFKQGLLERIINTPGVTSAAEVRHVPMSGTGSSVTVWLDGADPGGKTTVRLNAISERYLQTMSIKLVSGRDFTPHDSMSSPKVAIVNRSFARRLGIVGNPVGARFRAEGSSPSSSMVEIVGLVPDTKYFSLREDFLPIVFVPITQITDPRAFADFVIHPGVPIGDAASAVRRHLRETDPFVDVDIRAFDSTMRQGLVRERLLAAISAFFGVLAVLIAAVGLYGVMAELVTRRRGEIGVRMALGARRSDILAMILRQAGNLLLVGVGAGSLLAFLAAGLARPFVFGLEPHDVQLMLLAVASLGAPAMMAILVPACRAAWMEPLAALREE